MPTAKVTVKEGKSYQWRQYMFTKVPATISNPEHIKKLKTIAVLNVQMVDEKQAPGLKDAESKGAPASKGKSETKTAEAKGKGKPAAKDKPSGTDGASPKPEAKAAEKGSEK